MAARRGVGARVPDEDVPVGERASSTRRRPTSPSPSTRRSSRASRSSRSPTRTRTQVATASPRRSPANPDTLIVPLEPHLPEGWYLVYWRAISVDGHPVQGAFTFAVGPNPGPAPQFVIPHIAQIGDDAAARDRQVARVPDRDGLDRAARAAARDRAAGRPRRRRGEPPRASRSPSRSPRPLGSGRDPGLPRGVDRGRLAALGSSTSARSCRSGGRPRSGAATSTWRSASRSSSLAAWIALWVDRPEREQRSIAEILAGIGVVAAAAAVARDPGRRRPRGADRAARARASRSTGCTSRSGSLWLGGLVGLLVLWRSPARGRGASACSRSSCRASRTSRSSRSLVLLGSGIWATVLHLPILSALWTTSLRPGDPGQGGAARARRCCSARSTSLRTKPRLVAAGSRPELGRSAASLLRRLVSVEVLIVVAAVLAAALLSSLAPPSKYLAEEGRRAREGRARAGRRRRAPGRVYAEGARRSEQGGRAEHASRSRSRRTAGRSRGADVTVTFAMLDMEMGNQEYQLTETAPGRLLARRRRRS